MSQSQVDCLPGSSAPVLSAALLARIHDLNFDYLELLAAEKAAADGAGQLQHLPGRLHGAIGALTDASRKLLAAMPYTLYSLGFEDEAFWRAACNAASASARVSVDQRYAPGPSQSPMALFAELALVHAWHVASSSALAARVLYAMSDATARALGCAQLWYVRRIATDHPALLMPRWPTNPGFWPDLVRFAAANDTERLATAKLLGNQLIAAELELTAVRDGKAPAAHAASIQSPRLRARRLQFGMRGAQEKA